MSDPNDPMIPKRRHAVWTPALEPLESFDEPPVELPLLGYVSAGQPVETPDDRESLRVPRHLARRDSYALRVRGHSMTEDAIEDGDIIILEKRQSAANGLIVVAQIQGEQVTLKRLYVTRDRIRLQPSNPEMEPLCFRHGEVEILGILSAVVRMGR